MHGVMHTMMRFDLLRGMSVPKEADLLRGNAARKRRVKCENSVFDKVIIEML